MGAPGGGFPKRPRHLRMRGCEGKRGRRLRLVDWDDLAYGRAESGGKTVTVTVMRSPKCQTEQWFPFPPEFSQLTAAGSQRGEAEWRTGASNNVWRGWSAQFTFSERLG